MAAEHDVDCESGMDIVRVKTTESPAAVGPYSQASLSRGFLFTSGILPLDVSSGGLERGLKTTVYMTDMGDFTRMNDVYAEYFGSILPSRATIQVVALAKGAQIEIEAVALV